MPIQCEECRKLKSELTELKKSYREVKSSYLAATKTISAMMSESRIRYPEMTSEIASLRVEVERLQARTVNHK